VEDTEENPAENYCSDKTWYIFQAFFANGATFQNNVKLVWAQLFLKIQAGTR
jgi:hypothetical protein